MRVVVLSEEELRKLIREEFDAVIIEMKDDEPKGPVLLDRRGLARALGVSVPMVDKLRQQGVPSIKIGDSPRFHLEDVLPWLKERKR